MHKLWKTLFNRKKKKTEHELFLEFMRRTKETMVSDIDKAMMKYLEEIYNFAVKSQKKEDKKKKKVAAWISNDFEIDKKRILEEKEKENALLHPVELRK